MIARVPRRLWFTLSVLALAAVLSRASQAQTCLSSDDMDEATKTALITTAKNYFDMAAKGDVTTLQQNAIASLAANFSGIEGAVKDHQSEFAGVQAVARSPFELQAEGTAPLARAEFLCGVFNANGQTANSRVITIPNLPPGNYGLVTLDVTTSKIPYMVTFILQQEGTAWKLAGFFVKSEQIAGHDADWFLQKAGDFKSKGQNLDAWLYYQEARSLLVPVDFMSSQQTDKLYDEAQSVKPADLPPTDLVTNGKTYKLTAMFPLAVGDELDLIVKFDSADVSNTTQAFQDNMAVIKGLVAKYPELRNAFESVVARATDSSGRDYGSLLPMKDIK